MKKFNIICIICMLVMLIGIIYNFNNIDSDIHSIYYRVMLVLDGILFGMALGELYIGNMVASRYKFIRKENRS